MMNIWMEICKQYLLVSWVFSVKTKIQAHDCYLYDRIIWANIKTIVLHYKFELGFNAFFLLSIRLWTSRAKVWWIYLPPISLCDTLAFKHTHTRTYELIMQNPANAVETCQNNERSQFLFVEYFLVKTAHILMFVDVEKIN